MGIAAPDRPHPGIHSGRLVAPPVELTRRRLLGGAAAGGGGMLLASCGKGRADPRSPPAAPARGLGRSVAANVPRPSRGLHQCGRQVRKPALACFSNQDGAS